MGTLDKLAEETKLNSELIIAYFLDSQKYTGGESLSPPELSDLIDSLSYSDLLSYVNINESSSQTLHIGVLSNFVYWLASLIREGSLVYKTKASIYDESDLYSEIDQTEISDNYGILYNLLYRTTPSQTGLLG